MHHRNTMQAFHRRVAVMVALALYPCVLNAAPTTSASLIQYDPATHIFRVDAVESTYVFGVNEKQELQSLYWGKRLAASDHFAAAHSMPEFSSFDLPITVTPQEYVGWAMGFTLAREK
jgi:alpha-galactosidase